VRWLVATVTRRVALRADERGLTFGATPFPIHPGVTAPWSDIDQVEIFNGSSQGRAAFVGIRLRPEAPRPRGVPEPGTFRATLSRWNRLFQDLPDLFRAVVGWHLDKARLADTAARYDNRVRVRDNRYSGGTLP
jgi:hypothetical protein